MDLTLGTPSPNEQGNQSSDERRKGHKRYDPETTARLEKRFQETHIPTRQQMVEISKELALDPKQVQYWFQNRRTQQKIQNHKASNAALRVENERLITENIEMQESLKDRSCQSCKGLLKRSHVDQEDQSLEQLQLENAYLKLEQKRVSKFLSGEEPQLMQLTLSTTSSMEENVPKQTSKMTGIEKAKIMEEVMVAKEELLKAFRVKSQVDGRHVLGEHCDDLFPRINNSNGTKVSVESSKDSRIVNINATQLVDMLLDTEKWNNILSTIVTKAQTIEVLERGSSENHNGALLLMHVLSHLLPSRELHIIRYCEQIEVGIWIIVDLSYNHMKDEEHSNNWKCPSGCMIHQISNTSSQVFWVEHVELEDNTQTHNLYKNIANSTIAFGAKMWLMELQRMCERFASATVQHTPTYDSVVILPGGMRKMLDLSQQMIKSFCKNFTMSNVKRFPQFLIGDDNNRDMIFIQNNINLYSSRSTIVSIARSFSLPHPSHIIFDFFRDPKNRIQWDVLCCGNYWHEVAHISCGIDPRNCISIVQPLEPPPSDGVVIIQESFINPLGSFVVYSSVDMLGFKRALNDRGSSTLSLFPSGIVISEGHQSCSNAQASSSRSGNEGKKTRGSVLTIAFQIVMANQEVVSVESVDVAKSLMALTITKIKKSFPNGSNLG